LRMSIRNNGLFRMTLVWIMFLSMDLSRLGSDFCSIIL
jgi:hypothetical protein